jgi:hypothetical protein
VYDTGHRFAIAPGNVHDDVDAAALDALHRQRLPAEARSGAINAQRDLRIEHGEL